MATAPLPPIARPSHGLAVVPAIVARPTTTIEMPALRLIERFAPTWVAVVVSSVLFGALHMHSFALSEVLSVIPHAFFGLSCGLLYVKTDRNLLYPASIHCLNNLSAFLTLLLH